jgi:chromosome segregation and condensation protein ScpB
MVELTRLERIIKALEENKGKALSINQIREIVRIDARAIKTIIDQYRSSEEGRKKIGESSHDKYFRYFLRNEDAAKRLFEGWAGADRLGL